MSNSLESPSSPGTTAALPETQPDTRGDLTGRTRLTRNVLASWGGYAIFVISGFIMPRMIDRHLGQQLLGVWDFAWSLVVYFQLVQGGVVSSVNRYVAKYRAAKDLEGVNRAVSSATCILCLMGMVIVALSVAAAWVMPSILRSQLATHTREAQWVVVLLGSSLAVEIAFAGFRGVITGCHRWDIHNGLNAACYAGVTLLMCVVLYSGGGLRGLALVHLCGDFAALGFRSAVLAYRVCPGLSVRLRHLEWSTVREMLSFGGKSFLPNLANIIMNQTMSILVTVYMGPAALALFSRPRALVRHVVTFVNKFAFVLAPTASSLQAQGDHVALRDFFLRTSEYGSFIAFPLLLTLAIIGKPIMLLWMGPAYAGAGLILSIFAMGHCAFAAQQASISVLLGMNAHGRPGLANLLAAIGSSLLGLIALGPLQWGLTGAALAVAVPLTAVNGVLVPLHICRVFGITVRSYVSRVTLRPLCCLLPLGLCLSVVSFALSSRPIACCAATAGAGVPVLILTYWHAVLPRRVKDKVLKCIKWPLIRSDTETRRQESVSMGSEC